MNRATKSIVADVTSVDAGGFVAVASTPSIDRDGESLAAGCFEPLPRSIPVHVDHQLSAANVIARARPFYVADDLHIDATFASSREAQQVRSKVAEGILDSVSVVFTGQRWDQVGGVRTCTRAELLACDLVSIPSQRDARVLSVRSYAVPSRAGLRREVEKALVEAELALAEVDLAEAERHVRSWSRPRQQTDQALARIFRGGWSQ